MAFLRSMSLLFKQGFGEVAYNPIDKLSRRYQCDFIRGRTSWKLIFRDSKSITVASLSVDILVAVRVFVLSVRGNHPRVIFTCLRYRKPECYFRVSSRVRARVCVCAWIIRYRKTFTFLTASYCCLAFVISPPTAWKFAFTRHVLRVKFEW